ncbi:hypothetical protein HMPREF1221_00851 [Treponema socranskii subsp. paredis ATCC 35535]|nr:hypothetical protein HMPREF1221_00851 [Treponema socranskii subsp. paredis ATCC 35535]
MPDKAKKKNDKKGKRDPLVVHEYYTDCTKPDMLYGALVRGPVSSGTIVGISVPALPEGYAFFTARDIPGKNAMRTLTSETPVFCTERVSYFGEPVGIIVGPDEETVYELTSKIEIAFDSATVESALRSVAKGYALPAVTLPKEKSESKKLLKIAHAMHIDDPADTSVPLAKENTDALEKENEALAERMLKTREVVAERTVKTGCFLSEDKAKALFKNSDYTVSGTWVQNTVQPSWPETNGAFCFTENGMLTVFAPTQWPLYLKSALSASLKIPEDRIVIKGTNTSGHDANGMWRNATLVIQASLAAYLTGKPVKLSLSREEHKTFMKPGVAASITCESAVSKEGAISATKISIETDVGYCNPFAQEIVDRLVIASCGVYDIPNISISAKALTSPSSPTSVFADIIDAQAFFAIENHIQQIAERLNMLPPELRIKNMRSSSKERAMPFTFRTGKADGAIANAAKMSDYNRKYAAFKIDAAKKSDSLETFFALPIRGIGSACAFGGSGYLNNDLVTEKQKVSVTLEEDGTVTIHSPVPSSTISDIWTKLVSSLLKVPSSAVSISPEEQGGSDLPTPSSIYGNLSITTQLLHQCCTELEKKKAAKQALPITVKKGLPPAIKKLWNKENFSGTPFYTSSFGCAVVEIELDPYTYKERIKGIWITIDCGQVFELRAAENTIRIAIQQELAQLVKGESILCDGVHISFVQSDSPPSQIGNLVHSIIPAAFSAALSQALGFCIRELPYNAETMHPKTQNLSGENA